MLLMVTKCIHYRKIFDELKYYLEPAGKTLNFIPQRHL